MVYVAAHSVATASFHTGKLWRRLRLSSSISGQCMVAGSKVTCVSRKNRQKSSLCSCEPTMRERGILVPLRYSGRDDNLGDTKTILPEPILILASQWSCPGAL